LHDCARVADDTIPILAAMPALHTVDLTGTKVTTAGVEKLRRAKPDCRFLLAASKPKPETEAEP
jgi:hypothetical protein